MKLHLIRHAQTNANQTGQLSCKLDEELNQVGILQSNALKQYLSKLNFDEIWCSPLLRARQTILPYEETFDVTGLVEPLLSEGHLNLNSDHEVDLNTSKEPREDESTASFRGRCIRLLHKIKKLEKERTIIAITHGHYIREFLNLSLGIQNYTRFPVGNVSDTLIEFSENPIIQNPSSIWRVTLTLCKKLP